jgi:hypothetical protein
MFLDEFFRVSEQIDLPDGTKATMRVLSDIELNMRRDYALSEVMKVAEQLKDTNSDLYKTKIEPLSNSTLESLLELMSQGRMIELRREAEELYRVDFVPTPDNATLEEEIKTEEKQESVDVRVYKDRTKYVVDGITTYRNKVSELPRDTMLKELHQRAIQAYSYSASLDAEVYYTVWCATETEKGAKHWKTVDHVRQLPSKVIDVLYTKYKGLDAIDPWAITKSQSKGETDRVGADSGSITQSG